LSDDAVKVDTSVSNAARIWKLYGTMACKGDSTPDRPHRMASILHVPGLMGKTPRDLLEALAGMCPRQDPKPEPGYHPGGDFDLADWIRRHGLEVSREGPWRGGGYRWILSTCPWNPEHTDNSAFIVRWPDGQMGAGCHHNGCQGKGWKELRP